MQGENIEKVALPKQQRPYFLSSKQARSTFPAPARDTMPIVTELGFNDLIMTVSAFHKWYIINVFLTINWLSILNSQPDEAIAFPKVNNEDSSHLKPTGKHARMHPSKSYLILLQVKKTHSPELSGLQWFSMRSKPESGSLTDPQTPTRKSNMYPVLTSLNKIELGRETEEKYSVACQKFLAHKQIMPFTATSPCRRVANETCLYILWNVAFTEGGQESPIISALSCRVALKIVRV